MKKVAFICHFQDGRISGPSNSVTELAKYSKNVVCDVFTSKAKTRSFRLNSVQVNTFENFINQVGCYDLVVLAGIYDLNIFKASIECRKKGVPYIISPRSNLMELSFRKSWLKKSLAKILYVNKLIKNASFLHFLSDEEVNNSIHLNDNYFVAKNGVQFKPVLEQFDLMKKCKLITFIGRLDIHHKGLDLLIESLALIKRELSENGWSVRLYGPAEDKALSYIKKLLEKEGLTNLVSLCPPLYGADKFQVLAQTKVFLHPSRYEGQPQAVIESMAMGCIPVTTEGTNMKADLCKWHQTVSFDKYQYSSSIISAIKKSEHFDYLGFSSYARREYSWEVGREEFFSKCKSLGLL